METVAPCPVCGHDEWAHGPALWAELVDQWQLSDDERTYIDRQQGTLCTRCGAQIRIAALAQAIRDHYGWRRPLRLMVLRRPWLRVLEVNSVGSMHAVLRRYPRLTFAEYPDVDMQELPFEADSFDLVVHSDTLEHVDDPVRGLVECRRVLRPGGALIYTVPTVIGRLSRRRAVDEPTSYHGAEANQDYPVVTEYGADMWTEPLVAGFSSVIVTEFAYPAGLALTCRVGV